MSLSAKAQATRKRILDAAEMLFHLHGYNATGLDKVIKKAKITKGNFYYHFKSKEALAVATLDSQLSATQNTISEEVISNNNSALENLFELFEFLTKQQKMQYREGQLYGCYFGNFTLELSTTSQEIRNKVKEVFANLLGLFESLLTQAKEAGEIPDHIDPAQMSPIIMSQIEGAILLDKANQEPKNLDNSIKFIKQVLTT